ncbi:MAG: hypothetical protein EBU31_05700 [Proteobacteria bacterium]|nr:hypothetical protein [Pseudomonadota bacterium]
MRWLRNAAYLTAAAATSPIWSWRMHRTGKLRTDWAARFGRGEALPRTASLSTGSRRTRRGRRW